MLGACKDHAPLGAANRILRFTSCTLPCPGQAHFTEILLRDMAGIAFPADRIFSQTVRATCGARPYGQWHATFFLHGVTDGACLVLLSFCTMAPVKHVRASVGVPVAAVGVQAAVWSVGGGP